MRTVSAPQVYRDTKVTSRHRLPVVLSLACKAEPDILRTTHSRYHVINHSRYLVLIFGVEPRTSKRDAQNHRYLHLSPPKKSYSLKLATCALEPNRQARAFRKNGSDRRRARVYTCTWAIQMVNHDVCMRHSLLAHTPSKFRLYVRGRRMRPTGRISDQRGVFQIGVYLGQTISATTLEWLPEPTHIISVDANYLPIVLSPFCRTGSPSAIPEIMSAASWGPPLSRRHGSVQSDSGRSLSTSWQ